MGVTAKHKILTHEETMGLIAEAQGGSTEARDRLVEHNRRLIWNKVQGFKGAAARKLMELEDVFQLGVIGLMKAIDNFKPEYGTKFSTYAVPMVVGEIQRHMRDYSLVKIARGTHEMAVKIKRLGLPSLEDVSIEKLAELLDIELTEDNSNRIAEAVTYILTGAGTAASFEDVIFSSGSDPDLTLQDMLPGDINGNWFDNLALHEAIERLDDREKRIIKARYWGDKTQSEVAVEFGISQVQVSRLENVILGKLQDLIEADDDEVVPEPKPAEGLEGKDLAYFLARNTSVGGPDISERSGVPLHTVQRLIRENRPEELRKVRKKRGDYKRKKDVDLDEATRLVMETGTTAKAIAKSTGVSINKVYQMLKKRPDHLKHHKSRSKEAPKGDREAADKLVRETSKSAISISKETGVPLGTVHKWITLFRPLDIANSQIKGDVEEAIRLAKDIQLTAVNIAARTGVTLSRAQAIVKQHRPKKGTNPKGNRDRAVELLATTRMSYVDIYKETGVPTTTVMELAKTERPAHLKNPEGGYKGMKGRPAKGDREKAKELLKTTNMSRKQVSEATGVPLGSIAAIAVQAKKEMGGVGEAMKKKEVGVVVENAPVEEVKEVVKTEGAALVAFNFEINVNGQQIKKADAVDSLNQAITVLETVKSEMVDLELRVNS